MLSNRLTAKHNNDHRCSADTWGTVCVQVLLSRCLHTGIVQVCAAWAAAGVQMRCACSWITNILCNSTGVIRVQSVRDTKLCWVDWGCSSPLRPVSWGTPASSSLSAGAPLWEAAVGRRSGPERQGEVGHYWFENIKKKRVMQRWWWKGGQKSKWHKAFMGRNNIYFMSNIWSRKTF